MHEMLSNWITDTVTFPTLLTPTITSIYEPPQLPSPTPIYFQVSLEKWWKKLHWNLRAQLNMLVFLSPTQGGLHCFRDEIPLFTNATRRKENIFWNHWGDSCFFHPCFIFKTPEWHQGKHEDTITSHYNVKIRPCSIYKQRKFYSKIVVGDLMGNLFSPDSHVQKIH